MSRTPVLTDWEADPWDDPHDLYEFEGERKRKQRTPLKVVAFIAMLLLVASLIIGGLVGLWVVRQVNPPGTAGASLTFTVTDTDTVDTVSRRLEAQGVVTSAKVFRWYVGQKGGVTLTPGAYVVKSHQHMGDVMKALRTSPAQTYDRVTFPEGFTLDQMSRRLATKVTRLTPAGFMQAATSGEIRLDGLEPVGVNSLEGLLFPDTYQVAGNEDEASVVRRLLDQMRRVGIREGLDKGYGEFTPYQVLEVASIIEREARFDDDRPKIAQVIYTRLRLGVPLEVDATLYYGQDSKTPFDQLRALDTPYNTYIHKGLPPTPISNPGVMSIRAALNPAPPPPQTECEGKEQCYYLFYVLKDKEGHHAFATSYAQHLRNVEKARVDGVIP